MLSLLATLAAFARRSGRPDRAPSPAWATSDLRAGIIGTDTSHVPAFTKAFRDHPEWRIKVVAAYKGGSPDFPISANRVEGFAKTIHDDYGVELRRQHRGAPRQGRRGPARERGRPAAPGADDARCSRRGKRVFVDKPLAASLEDARTIAALAQRDRHAPVLAAPRCGSIPISRACGRTTRSARSSASRPTIS